MADENVKILRIDTGESEQTVKGLKEEIKDLRDNILNLEEGTDAYDKAVKKLQADQRKLDDVMSLTKKTATALDGSYDSLVFQMAKLKKEWRATNDEAKRNELGKQISSINTQLKGMDEEIGNYQRNVGNYTNSICDAFERLQQEISEYENKAAEAFNTGDAKAYANAIQEIGKRQTVIDKINNDSDMMNGTLEKRMEGLTSLASGIAGGFSAVQGVLALCGTESKQFEKVMVKLTAAMAIVQGVAGIAGMVKGIKSLISTIKALKVALVSLTSSNPVGLILTLVAALGGLIYSLASASDESDEYTESLEKQKAAQEALNAEYERGSKELERQIALQEAAGEITPEEALRKRIDFAKARLRQAEGWVNWAENEFVPKKIEKDGKYKREVLDFESMSDEDAEYYESLLDEAEKAKEKVEELEHELQLYLIKQKKAEEDAEKKALEDRLARIEKSRQSAIEAVRDVSKELSDLIEKEAGADIKIEDNIEIDTDLTLKGEREAMAKRKALKEAEIEMNEAMLQSETQVGTDMLDGKSEEDALRAHTQRKLDILKKYEEDRMKIEKDYSTPQRQGDIADDVKYEISSKELTTRQEMNDAILLNEKERAQKELEIQKNLNSEKLNLINEGLQSAIADGDLESIAELATKKADLELAIEKQKNEELMALRKQDLENQKQVKEQSVQIAMASAKVLGDSLGATAELYKSVAEAKVKSGEMSEAAYKKEMENVKNIQIAQTTISTLAASVEAFRAMAGIPVVGPALGAVAAASAIAMGIAQIIKIKNTDISSGNVPDLGGGTGSVMPDQSILDNAFRPQEQHILTGEEEEERLNQAQKVYILESDIQDSGRKVQVREDETTF